MALDPLLTDAELAELAKTPEAGTDDAGSTKMRSLSEIIEAEKYAAARKARRRGPFFSVTRGIPPGTVGPCGTSDS